MSEILNNLSNELAGLVKAASPSVVRIEARRRLPATGVVWSNDGIIVTTDHGIDPRINGEDITIGLDGGATATANLVGRDPSTDIAILKTDAELTAPAWSAVDDLSVGNLVLALGRPGDQVLATMGIVSALDGKWQTHAGGHLDHYLQTDVVMYPGFSGGPLITADNRVLGITSSGLIRGMSMAIPTVTLERVVNVLMEHGHIKRGFLGVGVQPVALPDAIAKQVEQSTGVLVMSVEDSSPAEAAGIVLGDTLVTLDGEAVTGVEELLALLAGERVGKAVDLQVLRAGQLTSISVTIGERNESAEEQGSSRRGRGWGKRGGPRGFRGSHGGGRGRHRHGWR